MSTEMSDLAAVRIHSKTISIFSSRPIISRKRCTDGDWSSVLTGRAAFEEMVEQIGERLVRPDARPYTRTGLPGDGERDPEVGELADAVLDVQRSRPNVCISDSTSKLSSGRALR